MATQIIAGPFSKEEAQSTANALGNQYSAFGREIKDDEGYGTDQYEWFVELDDSIEPDKIFGYETKAFLMRQYK